MFGEGPAAAPPPHVKAADKDAAYVAAFLMLAPTKPPSWGCSFVAAIPRHKVAAVWAAAAAVRCGPLQRLLAEAYAKGLVVAAAVPGSAADFLAKHLPGTKELTEVGRHASASTTEIIAE